MERKNIAFQYGIHRAPSSGNEGELAECVNLTPKNGELVTLQPPIPMGIKAPSPFYTIKFIHKTSQYKNYIFVYSSDAVSVSETGNTLQVISNQGEIKDMTALGNTLIVSTANGIFYILYKNGTYNMLGSKPPVMNMNFVLNGDLVTTTQESITLPEELADINVGETKIFSDANKAALQDTVFAHINKFISEEQSKGNFVSSFFVRWAYVMMGETYMASPPILMRLNEGFFPLVKVITNNSKNISINIEAYTAKLICIFNSQSSVLQDWKDVITGIEIYVSKPISRYEQSGSVDAMSMVPEDTISYSVMDLPITIDGTDEGIYAKRKLSTGGVYLTGMHKDKGAYYSQFVDNSLFYLLRRYGIDEMVNRSYVVNGSLSTIDSLPQLTNSGYQEYDSYIPDGMFVYNGRLNLYGVKEKKYAFPLGSLVQYTNGYDTNGTETEQTYRWKVRFIMSSGEEVNITSGTTSYFYEEPTYLFYPDSNIDTAIIERSNGYTTEWSTVSMKSHPYLQGSYWFNNFEPIAWSPSEGSLYATDGIVNEPNKIYTSEVNNPFIFPLNGINSVGTGEIIGISTVTQALSQGQFGQFPLYVFTNDGVWAMEVSDEGYYSSVHPISRDICNNKKSITQIDTGIIFSTDNGLKILNGSEIRNISQNMEYQNIDETPFNVLSDFSGLFIKDTSRFIEMLRTCIISYDYPHNLIHIYPSGSGKHFVYNLSNGEYSTYIGDAGNIIASVNDYPGMVSQIGDSLYSYDNQVSETIRKGMLITRPLVFSDPLAMKVLNDVRLIYHRTQENTRCRYAIFVSNDQIHWSHQTSLRGRSFKYFRFVIFTEMSDIDALTGMSIMFDYRRTNKLR